jgi:hypothetical protein
MNVFKYVLLAILIAGYVLEIIYRANNYLDIVIGGMLVYFISDVVQYGVDIKSMKIDIKNIIEKIDKLSK